MIEIRAHNPAVNGSLFRARLLAGGSVLALTLGLAGLARPQDQAKRTDTPIEVLDADRLPPSDIPAMRTPLGIADDYKPWVAQLKSSELLLVAFYSREVSAKQKAQGKSRSERAISSIRGSSSYREAL